MVSKIKEITIDSVKLCMGTTCITEADLAKLLVLQSKIWFICNFGGWNKYFGVGEYPNVGSRGMSEVFHH